MYITFKEERILLLKELEKIKIEMYKACDDEEAYTRLHVEEEKINELLKTYTPNLIGERDWRVKFADNTQIIVKALSMDKVYDYIQNKYGDDSIKGLSICEIDDENHRIPYGDFVIFPIY